MIDAKDRLIRIMGTFDLATGHADTMDQALDALEEELRDVLGYLRARREWVGLTANEVFELLPSSKWKADETLLFVQRIEDELKEKNNTNWDAIEKELPAEAFGELAECWKKRF